MAIVANLDIVMGTKTQQAERGLNKTRLLINDLKKSVAGLAAAFVSLRAAQAQFAAGLGFDRALTKSTALLEDLTAAQKDSLTKTALQIGLDPNVATLATEAAAAFQYLFLAGQSVEQALASLPQVARFATAGAFDMATATDLATDAQSALGLAVKDSEQNLINLTRVTDALSKASGISNASIEQFSLALTNKAGAALRVLGKDVEEGLAVLAAFADQGTKGAEGGTALTIVLRDLQKAATANEAAFKKAGINIFDAAGEMRNMADIVDELTAALGPLSDEGRINLFKDLGLPFKSLSFVQQLLGTGDKIREYEARVRSASGATEMMASRSLTKFDKAMKRITGTIAVLNQALVSPALNLFAEAVEKIAQVLNTSAGKTLAWVTATVGISLTLQTVIPILVTLTKAVVGFAKAQAVAIALGGPKGWATLAIGAGIAAGAIYGIDKALGEVNEKLVTIDQKSELDKVAAKSKQVTDELAKIAPDEFADGFNKAGDAVDRLAAKAESLTESLRTPFEDLLSQLAEIKVLSKGGFIDPSIARRGIDQALKEFQASLNSSNYTISANVEAAPVGSQQEFAIRYGQELKTTNQLHERSIEAEEAANETLLDILGELRNRDRPQPANLG